MLVADDHPVVREGIAAMLARTADLQVVAECADGDAAIEAWHALRPAVGLVDLRMPGRDGIATIHAIRRLDPEARLVALTTFAGEDEVYRALQAGASGYLLKDCGQNALIDGLRAVLRGQRHLDPAAAASLASRVLLGTPTARETEVLEAMALGLGNKAIARRLQVTEGTVKTHAKSLFAKLGASSRVEAVRIAEMRGLLSRGGAQSRETRA